MINVSNEFRILMNQRTDFKQNAEITLADGTLLTLSEKDFTIANNSVVDGAGSNGIPLGVAICRNIQIELMNDDERFSDYDFFGAVIRLYLTFQLSETVERIEYGTFTVLTPSTAGTTVIITALDDMYKADKEYSTGLTFPATVKSMWVDACNTIGIVPGTTSFNNDDFIVSAKPEGVTFRQVLGYIAMIAGGNARIDLTGRMQIVSYDFSAITDAMNMISGGNFKKWDNEETIDGGDFTFAEVDEVIDGGNFTDKLPYHILCNWKDLTIDTDDITITGVSTIIESEDGKEEVLIYGSEGYMLSIDNPLIIGNERLAVQLIGEIMVGGTFRQFTGDIAANPLIEFMDTVLVFDRKMNIYPSFVTDINFQFFGFTSIKNSATPVLTNGNIYPADSTKTLVKARELINKERTAREAAVAQLAKDLANSSGLFMTQEVQSDGSIIYYMHDKPTLAESMIIWKLTALAFGISTDGGKTYPYGFTVDGTTITRLLYAEGIDADYINTGALRIANTSGKELFYADYDTKAVRINADNVFIGSKSVSSANTELSSSITANSNAITAEVQRAQGQEVELAAAISLTADQISLKVSKGDVSSQLSVESGAVTIKSNRFSWESTYSSLTSAGKLTATDVDLKGKISASSGDIGGFTIASSSLTASSVYGSVELSTEKIKVGTSSTYFEVARTGEVTINGVYSSISLGSSTLGRMYLNKDGISFGFSNYTTEITKEKVRVNNHYIDSNGFWSTLSGGVGYNYTNVKHDGITIKGNGTNYIDIGTTEIKLYLDGSHNITLSPGKMQFGSNTSLHLRNSGGDNFGHVQGASTISSTMIELYPGYLALGNNLTYLSFFGNSTKSRQVSVAAVSSSAKASTIASKLNELINALKAYNLIG